MPTSHVTLILVSAQSLSLVCLFLWVEHQTSSGQGNKVFLAWKLHIDKNKNENHWNIT